MLGVKITIIAIIISVLWWFVLASVCKADRFYHINHSDEFHFYGLGILVLLDMIGIIYSSIYFIFFWWK